jgi:hypothetical protein
VNVSHTTPTFNGFCPTDRWRFFRSSKNAYLLKLMRVTSFLALLALTLAFIASAAADSGLIELHDAKPIVDYITPVEPKAMSPTVGGWTDQTSSKEPEKEEVVNWTLAQTKKLKNVGEGDKLTVQSVKTQVVAGLNYDIVTKQETADGKVSNGFLLC